MNEICHFTLMISLCQHRKTAKQSTLQHIDGSEEIFLSSSTEYNRTKYNRSAQGVSRFQQSLKVSRDLEGLGGTFICRFRDI